MDSQTSIEHQDAEQKPRIMIVIGVLWVGGGAEKVAASLGNYLTDNGYETHLLTFYEHGEKYPYHGIYHSFNESPKSNRLLKIFRIPLRVWKIHRYARTHNIDNAYSFLEEANFYTLTAKLLFQRSLPVIVSVRNNIRRRSWFFNRLAEWLYPHAKKVVSVTCAIEQMLIDDFGLTNTTTIYNPLDMDMIESKKAEPLSAEYRWLTERSPLCITIGRLTHQKGQWHLIRAFNVVVEKHPTATLLIIGDGEYREKLQQLIEDCGLTENVYLLCNHTNVYQFLNAADLFVFSSLWEGMPNTMLEALAVGLPIVSTDCVSGPREILAPERAVDEPIDYPYRSPHGTLTSPFDYDVCWQPSSVAPLTNKEVEFAAAIGTMISRVSKGRKDVNNRTRTSAFAYHEIMEEWEALCR